MLTIGTIISTEPWDAIIAGICAIAAFIYASNKKRKWETLIYFSLAIVIAIYMTRSFWLSLSWWIYLFIAGIGLIALAMYNEARKKKLKEKEE